MVSDEDGLEKGREGEGRENEIRSLTSSLRPERQRDPGDERRPQVAFEPTTSQREDEGLEADDGRQRRGSRVSIRERRVIEQSRSENSPNSSPRLPSYPSHQPKHSKRSTPNSSSPFQAQPSSSPFSPPPRSSRQSTLLERRRTSFQPASCRRASLDEGEYLV